MLYLRWVQVVFIRLIISALPYTDTLAVYPRLNKEDSILNLYQAGERCFGQGCSQSL